jgi:sortase A
VSPAGATEGRQQRPRPGRPPRRRPTHPDERPVRRALRGLSTVLIAAGVLVLADAGLTLTWQEPLSSLWTAHRQCVLRGQLRGIATADPSTAERRALTRLDTNRARIAYLAEKLRRRTDHGQALGRIQIPHADADFVIVKGSDPADLRKGPGLYDGSPLPGSPGTVAIAGHRTTFLAPFRHIDRLRAGDRITVDMPYARFTYRVDRTQIVRPSRVSVIRRIRYDQLVITACHPLFSAAQRIVVSSRLIAVRPEGILGRYG